MTSGYAHHNPEDGTLRGETQWEDLLIDMGVMPIPDDPNEGLVDFVHETVAGVPDELGKKTIDELSDLEDEEDAEALEMYRARRMLELQYKADTEKFKGIEDITFERFDAVCVAGSKDNAVIMMLYVPRSAACDKMEACLARLSERHPTAKFVKMLASLTSA